MNIVIIDDHPVVLNGTKAILAPHFDVEIIEGSKDAFEMLESAMEEKQVDLCLIDVQMPEVSGVELCKKIRARYPNIKLILYTGYEVNDYVELLVHLQIDGIISKTASKEQLVNSIEGALLGNVILPVELFTHIVRSHKQLNEEKEGQLISEKELVILQRVAEGLTNKAIALEMGVSQRTIENHLTRLFDKLQVSSRAEAVMKAKDHQII